MGREITANVSAMIMNELNRYSSKIVDDVNATSKKYANKLKRELNDTSPKKTGEYAKGWRVKQVYKSHTLSQYVVHNATKPHVTHLLEHGHAIHGGSKRVAPRKHIEPAELKILNEFQDELERKIKGEG